MSAVAATAARSGVFEWQIVTVASRCSSSIAIGFPTISLRPITTACAPAIAMPLRTSSSTMPDGVHGISRARPCTSRPTFVGWKPSTSLAGSIASNTRCAASAPHRRGKRRLHEDAVVHGARVQVARRAPEARRASRWRAGAAGPPTARTRCRCAPCSARRFPTTDRRRRARSPRPGGRPARAVNACTSGRTDSRICAAIARPSRRRALTVRPAPAGPRRLRARGGPSTDRARRGNRRPS